MDQSTRADQILPELTTIPDRFDIISTNSNASKGQPTARGQPLYEPESDKARSNETAGEHTASTTRKELKNSLDTAIQVSRARRRGFLANVTIIPEVENPLDYPHTIKWSIVFIVALAASAAPVGSGIILRMSALFWRSLAWLTLISLTRPDWRGTPCLPYDCEPECRFIYAQLGDFSNLVVRFLRNIWPS